MVDEKLFAGNCCFVSRRLGSPRNSPMNKSNNLEKGYLKVLVHCINNSSEERSHEDSTV